MTKTNESLEAFNLNSTDQIRIRVEQQGLKTFNELNNDDLSIDIISNAYEDLFFLIKDTKLKDLKFKILPELTIFQKKVIYHFYNRESDKTIDILASEDGMVFKINFD